MALTRAASNPSALASLLNLNISSLSAFFSSPEPVSSLINHVPLSSPRSSSNLLAELISIFGSPRDITDAARAAFKGVAGAFTTDEEHLSAIQHRIISGVGSGGLDVAGPPLMHKTYMAAGALLLNLQF